MDNLWRDYNNEIAKMRFSQEIRWAYLGQQHDIKADQNIFRLKNNDVLTIGLNKVCEFGVVGRVVVELLLFL